MLKKSQKKNFVQVKQFNVPLEQYKYTSGKC